jgi:hypothetical protein
MLTNVLTGCLEDSQKFLYLFELFTISRLFIRGVFHISNDLLVTIYGELRTENLNRCNFGRGRHLASDRWGTLLPSLEGNV